MYKLDAVLLDKTGTVTKGKPEVTDFVTFGGNETKLLAELIAAEKASEHPLAEAIVAYGEENDIESKEADNFKAIPGRGIEAIIDGKQVFVGTRKLMKRENINFEEHEEKLSQLEQEGKTAMLIASETMKNIRQNLFWALAYNSAGVPIAALGLLAPWVAGAAMAFSSVSVVSNALRLKRVRI
jgi:cation transport ATPase